MRLKLHHSSIVASLQDQSILTITARGSLLRHRSMQHISTLTALDNRCSTLSRIRTAGRRSTPPRELHLAPQAVRQEARMERVCACMSWSLTSAKAVRSAVPLTAAWCLRSTNRVSKIQPSARCASVVLPTCLLVILRHLRERRVM